MLSALAQTYTYTTESSSGAGFSMITLIFYFAIIIAGIVALWKVFEKADQPGWAAIIPIYNTYTMLKIVNRPVWWLLLFFIPFVNLVVALIVSIDMAKVFGKGTGFGIVALFFFSIIGYLILGFGDATYTRPSGTGSAKPAVA